MKKDQFRLVSLPQEEKHQSFFANYLIRNQMRSLRTATQHIANLIKLGRYAEAEVVSRKLSGIIKTWDLDQKAKQEAAMKQSNPATPILSKQLQAVR